MKCVSVVGLAVCLSICFFFGPSTCAGEKKDKLVGGPRSRTFRLEYGATLHELPNDSRVRVWLPVPQSNDHQEIQMLGSNLPAEGKIATEPTYDNKILYFQIKAPSSGSLGFSTSYRVAFTTGRDIELVPRQEGAALNLFVYPYVEVNGTPWPKEYIRLSLG